METQKKATKIPKKANSEPSKTFKSLNADKKVVTSLWPWDPEPLIFEFWKTILVVWKVLETDLLRGDSHVCFPAQKSLSLSDTPWIWKS